MLTIRMQRTGRKAKALFRIVVQDSRFSPTSGRVVAQLGHYDPHTKETTLDKAQAEKYLSNGAQPSERVIRLFIAEKIALPKWVDQPRTDRASKIKNAEKLRRNQPKEEAPAEEAPVADEPAADAPAEEAAPAEEEAKPEAEATEAPAEDEKPADEA